MILTESQKRGVLSTVVFHSIALLILLLFGLKAPFPPPPEQGIMLDFGISETGFGIEEPSAGQPVEDQSDKTNQAVVPREVAKEPVKSKTTPRKQESFLTQDYEKTVAINSAAKKKADAEKEKIHKAEAEKKRLEEIEKNRLAEAERIRKEEESKKISSINTRAKNAFGAGGLTNNGSKSTGQGVTYGPGNQGSPDGTPGANQFGLGGGSGNGIGNGPSFSLSGRSAQSLPKPSFPGNESGIVVVEVTVNKFGKVTEALPGVKGSNTINSDLLQAAKKAALSASFNSDPNAPAFQKGTITYHFVLQ